MSATDDANGSGIATPAFAVVAAAALLLGLLAASPASAKPGSGPHETVDITSTTTHPRAAAGFNWHATFRNPANPHADPPALRRLVIEGPPGTKTDTSAIARCRASDTELRQKGESACPANTRYGYGKVTVRIFGVIESTLDSVVFNADHAQIELFKFMGGSGGFRRGVVRGRSIDAPVPTCLLGGQPPKDCPFDQVVVLSNELHTLAVGSGKGRHRRNLLTAPGSCPRSRWWKTHVTFDYADGSADRVVTKQRCTRR